MEKTENTLLLEKRVSILEEQVLKLQMQVAALTADEIDEAPQTFIPQEDVEALDSILQEEETPPDIILQEEEVPQVVVLQKEEPATAPEIPSVQSTPKSDVSWESKIGKKLIPIAGSALILVALVLFGSLIRPHLTDGMKAFILASISLAITGVGLWKMNSENKFHHFFSALASCGVSACYTSRSMCCPKWG